MPAIFFGLVGLLLFGTLVIGLLGLLSKSNRKNEEYVKDVKSVGWTAFQWFVIGPVYNTYGFSDR